jgi:hypothetical protein
MKNLFAGREQSRWTRPDAFNFVRPDWRRHVKAGSDAADVFTRYERKWRPDQARHEDGRFAYEGRSKPGSGSSVVVAGLPRIPKNRPPTPGERSAVAKAVAIALVEAGVKAKTVFDQVKETSWLYHAWPSIVSYTDAPKSLGELQENARSARPGYDRHHIVEQSSAEIYGYPRRKIDDPENVVSIPRMKHWEINAWYQTKNREYGMETPRDYLRGKDWDERQRVGLKALRKYGVLK